MNEITIYDIIGQDYFGAGITALDIKSQLDSMKGDITVRINSPGGDVFEGLAIYNLLEQHDGEITVKIDGWAASIASVIAVAGDRVEMADNAMFMIHNPWTFALGDADFMRKQADVLDKVKVSLIKSYRSRVKLDEEELAAQMDAETWMNSDEAIAAGFADSVSGSGKMQNLAGCRWIKNAPKVEERSPAPSELSIDLLTRSNELAAYRADLARTRARLSGLR